MSAMDKIRSFAESRASDDEMLPDGSLSYGDVRAVMSWVPPDEALGADASPTHLLRLLYTARHATADAAEKAHAELRDRLTHLHADLYAATNERGDAEKRLEQVEEELRIVTGAAHTAELFASEAEARADAWEERALKAEQQRRAAEKRAAEAERGSSLVMQYQIAELTADRDTALRLRQQAERERDAAREEAQALSDAESVLHESVFHDDGVLTRKELEQGLPWCIRLLIGRWQEASNEAAAVKQQLREASDLVDHAEELDHERDAAVRACDAAGKANVELQARLTHLEDRADAAETRVERIAATLEKAERERDEAEKRAAEAELRTAVAIEALRGLADPITGDEFFMIVGKYGGWHATFGGPRDSYTMSRVNQGPGGGYIREHYCHDQESWRGDQSFKSDAQEELSDLRQVVTESFGLPAVDEDQDRWTHAVLDARDRLAAAREQAERERDEARRTLDAVRAYCEHTLSVPAVDRSEEGLYAACGHVRDLLGAPPSDDAKSVYPGCHAGTDGECNWAKCPQSRDGEPERTGRHCPRDRCGHGTRWDCEEPACHAPTDDAKPAPSEQGRRDPLRWDSRRATLEAMFDGGEEVTHWQVVVSAVLLELCDAGNEGGGS
jgi:hypothetical protein